MSTLNDGGPAFPRDHAHDGHNGLSLRDYFAAKAMQELIAGGSTDRHQIAQAAYLVSDAMIKARALTP